MTEEEAKTKWCPFAHDVFKHTEDGATISVAAGNRVCDAKSGKMIEGCCCLGSACMAWRWKGVSKDAPPPYEPIGYCGMGGKP